MQARRFISTLQKIISNLGGDYGPNVRRWGDNSKIANLGQTFIAVDPKFFAPGYENRVDDLIQCLRNLTPVSHY